MEYAVRIGKTPGIYSSWAECEKQVKGFPGAEYKKFKTEKEAYIYINKGTNKLYDKENNDAVYYVDGSYNKLNNTYGYGVLKIINGNVIGEYNGNGCDKDAAKMNNVAGELKGAMFALNDACKCGHKSILICHDYIGIANWCTGEWKAEKQHTKIYAEFMAVKCKEFQIRVNFKHVKGHSGDIYNDKVDTLAREAVGLN